MKIKFVYGILPAFVFHTDKIIKSHFDAMAFGPVILIRKSWKDNIPLLKHELVHVKQYYRYLGLMGLFYHLSRKFRLKFELEAHKVQLDATPVELRDKKLVAFSHNLAQHYKLNITPEHAKELLSK